MESVVWKLMVLLLTSHQRQQQQQEDTDTSTTTLMKLEVGRGGAAAAEEEEVWLQESSSTSSNDKDTESLSVDYFFVVLALLYLALLMVVVVQIVRILRNRHKLFSFHFIFLSLCFVWSSLRAALCLTLIFVREEDVAFGFLLPLAFIPFNLQFATFTLIVLFYASIVHRVSWETSSHLYYSGWLIVNVILLILNVIWITLTVIGVVDINSDMAIFIRFIFPGILFLTLTILIVIYGFALYKVARSPTASMSLRTSGASIKGIVWLSLLLFVVFCGRTVYLLEMAYEAFLHDIFLSESSLARFLSLLITEILPTLSILVFFRHIPANSHSMKNNRRLPPFYKTFNDSSSTLAVSNRKSFFADEESMGDANYGSGASGAATSLSSDYYYGQSVSINAGNVSLPATTTPTTKQQTANEVSGAGTPSNNKSNQTETKLAKKPSLFSLFRSSSTISKVPTEFEGKKPDPAATPFINPARYDSDDDILSQEPLSDSNSEVDYH